MANSALRNYWSRSALALNPDPNAIERAFKLEQKAVAQDNSLSAAHTVLDGIYMSVGQPDRAYCSSHGRWKPTMLVAPHGTLLKEDLDHTQGN